MSIYCTKLVGLSYAHARVKLKTSIVGKGSLSKEPVAIADALRRAIDGTVLHLKDGMQGIVKHENSVIDLPNANKARKVQQYYEVLVR